MVKKTRLSSRYAQQAVHFVRLAAVAVAAELRYRVATGGGCVLALDEEHGGVAAVVVRVNGHAVLIVAGRAGDRGDRSSVSKGGQSPVDARRKPDSSGEELGFMILGTPGTEWSRPVQSQIGSGVAAAATASGGTGRRTQPTMA